MKRRQSKANAMNMVNINSALQSPLDFALSERDRDIKRKIETAIRMGNTCLAYQPVVTSRASDRVAFYEGLIRILDADGSVLPAGDFMHIAESRESGRIIDCLALEAGLEALAQEPTLRLSINMSARTIGYSRWMDSLERGLHVDRTIAERLILEITEASAMAAPDLVCTFMEELHCLGISFALDDFGAGYTAFRYFKEFNFDILKVDGQFIRNINEDTNNQVLASALVSIGQHFDMLTVAETVETPAEAAFLASAGFDCLQGYHFGRPSIHPFWQDQHAIRAAG